MVNSQASPGVVDNYPLCLIMTNFVCNKDETFIQHGL